MAGYDLPHTASCSLIIIIIIIEKRTLGAALKNRLFYMLISVFKNEYDGGRIVTALANHRFKPFL